MGEVAGWTVVGGSSGGMIVIKDWDGKETLLRHIQPLERCEVYITPPKKRKPK